MNWIIELKKAIEKEPTMTQMKRLLAQAGRWPTCACGELCKRLPRDKDKCPKDNRLRTLGQDFCLAVMCRGWPAALVTFREIEARTAELLAEQGKET